MTRLKRQHAELKGLELDVKTEPGNALVDRIKAMLDALQIVSAERMKSMVPRLSPSCRYPLMAASKSRSRQLTCAVKRAENSALGSATFDERSRSTRSG